MHALDSVTVNFTTKGDGVPESRRHADKFAVNIGVWRGDGPRTPSRSAAGDRLGLHPGRRELAPGPFRMPSPDDCYLRIEPVRRVVCGKSPAQSRDWVEWVGGNSRGDNRLQKIRTWVRLARWTIPRFPIASRAAFRSAASKAQGAEGPMKNFSAKIPCNPLISLDSDEKIQGNPRKSNPLNRGFSKQNSHAPRHPKRPAVREGR